MLRKFCIISVLLFGLSNCAAETTGVWTEIYSHSQVPILHVPIEPPPLPEDVILTYASPAQQEPTYTTDNPSIEPEESIQEELLQEEPTLTEPEPIQEVSNGVIQRPRPIPTTNGTRQIIALTFDDGPIQQTEYILDVLEYHGARATFCVLGYRVEDWASTVLRTIALGSEVVGHSWGHPNFTLISQEEIAQQITDTSAAIESVIGIAPPPIFRAPFGIIDDVVTEVAEELGYSFLHWSVDTRDWEFRDVDHVYNYIIENAVHGAIVLMHDIRPTTAEAMERVVPSLIELGFELVTATELIEYVYGELEPGGFYRGIRPPRN